MVTSSRSPKSNRRPKPSLILSLVYEITQNMWNFEGLNIRFLRDSSGVFSSNRSRLLSEFKRSASFLLDFTCFDVLIKMTPVSHTSFDNALLWLLPTSSSKLALRNHAPNQTGDILEGNTKLFIRTEKVNKALKLALPSGGLVHEEPRYQGPLYCLLPPFNICEQRLRMS
jgi:hypothetical protein